MTFEELNLSPLLLQALKEKGYETPSKIQEEAIPHVLAGKDVFGCAQTGTGKTAAFALPIIQQLMEAHTNSKKKTIRSLILTPTRELALQIKENFDDYAAHTSIVTTVIFGGVSQVPQVDALRRGTDVLVATPGRLNDLMNQGEIELGHVEIFVLDEADRMLDMGFIHDVKKIIAKVPEKRQTLLFSATMPDEIMALAAKLLHDPVTVSVTPVSSTVDIIDSCLYYVDKANKRELLSYVLKHENITSTLVFTRTKHGADRVVKYLVKEKISAAAIHGDKSQNARQRALEQFKDGTIRVLVATDIAARGIDIDKLSCVINFEIPNVPETYVHRIGRTGRAGRDGRAISFSDFEEKAYIKDIEKLIGKKIPVVEEHPYPMEVLEVLPKNTQARPSKAERLAKAAEKAAAKAGKGRADKLAESGKKARGKASGKGKTSDAADTSGNAKTEKKKASATGAAAASNAQNTPEAGDGRRQNRSGNSGSSRNRSRSGSERNSEQSETRTTSRLQKATRSQGAAAAEGSSAERTDRRRNRMDADRHSDTASQESSNESSRDSRSRRKSGPRPPMHNPREFGGLSIHTYKGW